jgi:hypothetical protein
VPGQRHHARLPARGPDLDVRDLHPGHERHPGRRDGTGYGCLV